MSSHGPKLTPPFFLPLPLWVYTNPPEALTTDDWRELYRSIADPVGRVVTLGTHYAGLRKEGLTPSRSLLNAWYETLTQSMDALPSALKKVHGRANRTWEAAEAIQCAVMPIMSSVGHVAGVSGASLANWPDVSCPTWRMLWDKLGASFDGVDVKSLFDNLKAATVADCDAGIRPGPLATPGTDDLSEAIRHAAPPATGNEGGEGVRPATINERMLAMLERHPERLKWSAQNFADELGCRKSTVHATDAWQKRIMPARALAQAERAGRSSNEGL